MDLRAALLRLTPPRPLLVAVPGADLTRVAVIGLWGLRNSHVDAPPGDIHNDWAHAVGENDDVRYSTENITSGSGADVGR